VSRLPDSPVPPGSEPAPGAVPAPDGDTQALVDRLADGTLDAGSRARLDAVLRRSPAIARDVATLQATNGRLKTFFADTGASPAGQAAGPARGGPISRRATLMLAAAACLVIGGVVLAIALGGSESPWATKARELYRSIEAAGFKPDEVCTTPEQFAKWTKSNIGETLTPKLGVPGLELVGWNKAYTFSPYTGVLIARVDGRGVIVLLDRAADTEGESVRDLGNGLKAFFTKLGSVGAVEVTPLDAPRVTPTITSSGR
jgi:hypothetical protein